MRAVVLVVAKAPVPGLAKTRLGRCVGDAAAADLAAAALLDTMDVVERVTRPGQRMLSLAGDLGDASRGGEIRGRLAGWHVRGQRGDTLAERLVAAHHDAATAWPDQVVLQIGMDTPGLSVPDLEALADASRVSHEVGLGP